MEGVGLIGTVIIGGLAGWIAEKAMKAEHGLLTNILLGILGAVALNFILVAIFGVTWAGWLGQLVIAAIGASLLIAGYRTFVQSRG